MGTQLVCVFKLCGSCLVWRDAAELSAWEDGVSMSAGAEVCRQAEPARRRRREAEMAGRKQM